MENKVTTLETLHVDNIDNFNWDSEVSEVDFFGETVVNPKEEKSEVQKDTNEKDGTKSTKEVEEVENTKDEVDEDEIFGSFLSEEEKVEKPNEENTEDEKPVNKDKKVESASTNSVLEFFKKQR